MYRHDGHYDSRQSDEKDLGCLKFNSKSLWRKILRHSSKAAQKKGLEPIGKGLAKDPYPNAFNGEFKGLYRWRTERFRVLYEIQKDVLIILVLKIGHRTLSILPYISLPFHKSLVV